MEFLIPLAVGLIVYITMSVYQSVKTHNTIKVFNDVLCKCNQCHTVTPILDYKLIKIYKLMQDDVIESYFICPHCHTHYSSIDDLLLYAFKNQILQHK